jgi:hypothetical protein
MLDDFRPYIFKTVDGGKTWTNMSGNLPAKAYVQIIREDPRNTNLLYAGTELGLFVSYNGGQQWIPLNLKNLPNVSVHDILIHPRENDLILATHGRSIWIFDDATPIQQLNQQIVDKDLHLFPVRPGLRFASRFTRYGIGDKQFTGPNPPGGALITYYLKEKPDDKTAFKVEVFDREGKLVQNIEKPTKEKGLNRITWNLRLGGPEVRRLSSDDVNPFGGGPRGPLALPGQYTVKVTLGTKTIEERVDVKLDPTVTVSEADLKTTQELQIKLRDMQSTTNLALRFLDSLKDQLKNSQTIVKGLDKEPNKDLTKGLEDYIKAIDTLQDRLTSRSEGLGFSGRSQVNDDISGLFFALDGNTGVTPGQRQYFQEFEPVYRSRIDEVNKFMRDTLPQWNEKLRTWNAPTLTTRRPFEF